MEMHCDYAAGDFEAGTITNLSARYCKAFAVAVE